MRHARSHPQWCDDVNRLVCSDDCFGYDPVMIVNESLVKYLLLYSVLRRLYELESGILPL